MLDFLRECDISSNVIQKIEKENSKANIYNLCCNLEEVLKIVNYFKMLNINCIDELLIYRISFFFNSYEEIIKLFSKYNILDLVEKINEDYMVIDEIN